MLAILDIGIMDGMPLGGIETSWIVTERADGVAMLISDIAAAVLGPLSTRFNAPDLDVAIDTESEPMDMLLTPFVEDEAPSPSPVPA